MDHNATKLYNGTVKWYHDAIQQYHKATK